LKDNTIKKGKENGSGHKRNKSEGEFLKQENRNFMKLNGEEITNSHNDRLDVPSELSKQIYNDHHEAYFFYLFFYCYFYSKI